MSSTPYGHYPRKTVRDAPPPRQGRQAGVCTRIASARLYPETMTPFPEKVPFRGSDPTPPPVFVSFVCFVVLKFLFVPLRGSSSTPSSVFVCFVCFVVLKILFVPIRVHSWFLVFSVPLRGSVFFRVFRVFRGSIPSCPFVVLFFPVCFVVLKFLFVPIRVYSWFLVFSVPLRGSVFSVCFVVQSPLSPWP